MNKILLLLVLITSLFSQNTNKPMSSFIASGGVIDLIYKDNRVYAATDTGVVDIFDYKTKKIVKKIKVDKIKDFKGDIVDSKVFSVDKIGDDIMVLSQDEKGFSRVNIYKNSQKNTIIDSRKKLSIIKAKYLDQNTILLALLSNELISYDIAKAKQNYRVQVSGGRFSDFRLNETGTQTVVADEGGDIHIYDTKNGKKIKTLGGQNLDNIFQIDYKNGLVITAGQDRKIGIYTQIPNSAYSLESQFLVYSVGLSPKGHLAGYSCDENNNVAIFNTATKMQIGIFGGNNTTISNIIFISEKEFLTSSNNKIVNLYKIK
ncbi:WD40 repeat domain-containing protein [Sulfurimonas sp.]|uniref:WD40 repeat domain-containing protein n=1 Tax=Sulfurimonas sp. TaxID=2022749 RepID=UPI0025E5C2E0|nr:WD40 repeat domain-containing protein [Sulfurimonas sp.]MDD5158253.1 WD40 repeat domain-containing protein [Sulfurimonas sp.]